MSVAGLNEWTWGAGGWVVIGLGIALAYIVFGIAGFGTALVAGPILILFMPLSKIVPLLVLLMISEVICRLLDRRRGRHEWQEWSDDEASPL